MRKFYFYFFCQRSPPFPFYNVHLNKIYTPLQQRRAPEFVRDTHSFNSPYLVPFPLVGRVTVATQRALRTLWYGRTPPPLPPTITIPLHLNSLPVEWTNVNCITSILHYMYKVVRCEQTGRRTHGHDTADLSRYSWTT